MKGSLCHKSYVNYCTERLSIMTLKKLINSNKSLILVKSIIENISCNSLQLRSTNSEEDELYDSAIVNSLLTYYDDIESSFIDSHIPPSNFIMPVYSFSSLIKWSHIIFYNDKAVGKIVLTIKRNQSIKIGPIYILPKYQRQGCATLALGILTNLLLNILHFRMTYATISEKNIASIKLFKKVGYSESHRLRLHYNSHSDEIVYIKKNNQKFMPSQINVHESKHFLGDDVRLYLDQMTSRYFFPVDTDWKLWLKNISVSNNNNFNKINNNIIYHFSIDCKIATLSMKKRGGTLKIILFVQGLVREPDLFNILCKIIDKAKAEQSRKIAVFIPNLTKSLNIMNVLKSIMEQETIIPLSQYSIYDSILIFSLFI